MLLTVASFVWLHPAGAIASTTLLASAEGQFNQNPLLPPPHDQMYICWGSYQSTWSISNTTQGFECLYGNDGGQNGSTVIPATIDIVYPFHLSDTRFLIGADAKMNVTGIAELTSDKDTFSDLHFYLFNFATSNWNEIGTGIPQSPRAPYTSLQLCANYTEYYPPYTTIPATQESVLFNSNLTNYADSNGNMKLRWFVQDTSNLSPLFNDCLYARIDYMSIKFTATSLPDFTMRLKSNSINIKDPPQTQTINTVSTA